MLTDEEIISIRRLKDCYTKLIELNRLNFIHNETSKEMYTVFRDVHKIIGMDEKILYLLFTYIVNSDEDVKIILKDTDIMTNDVVSNFFSRGISINELISPILKDYINNCSNKWFNIKDSVIRISDDNNKDVDDINCEKNDIKGNLVDYNLRHLKKENIKGIELRNQKLKRKIRRKTLYDKYQREW